MTRGYARRWQRCHRPKSHKHETRRMPEVFKRIFCYIQQPGSRRLSVHSESVDSERLVFESNLASFILGAGLPAEFIGSLSMGSAGSAKCKFIRRAV